MCKTKINGQGAYKQNNTFPGQGLGACVILRTGFKPTATIRKDQNTIDSDGNPIILNAKGRHDPCVVPRAVPIVEAMAALVIADFKLLNEVVKNK